MTTFLLIIGKIIPFYLVIFCGYLAGKVYKISKEQIATLNIYIVAPAIILLGTLDAGLNKSILSLPLLMFLMCIILCLINYPLGKFLWKDKTANLFVFASVAGNTGYFGIPISMAILGDQTMPIAVMMTLGLIIFESTFGYYILARSQYSAKDSLKELLRLPALYAFLVGFLVNLLVIKIPAPILDTFTILKGAYAPLGMMIVGLGLASTTIKDIDKKFIFFTHVNKFLVWFLFMSAVIYLDKNYFQFFNVLIYKVLLIMAGVPIAANTVAFAAKFKANPEKAAVAVVISNFVALVSIPVAVMMIK